MTKGKENLICFEDMLVELIRDIIGAVQNDGRNPGNKEIMKILQDNLDLIVSRNMVKNARWEIPEEDREMHPRF